MDDIFLQELAEFTVILLLKTINTRFCRQLHIPPSCALREERESDGERKIEKDMELTLTEQKQRELDKKLENR